MSEWTKTRTCEKCGKTFSLSDYGSETARATAASVEGGLRSYDKKANYIILDDCPACYEEIVIGVITDEVYRQAAQRKQKKWWQFWK